MRIRTDAIILAALKNEGIIRTADNENIILDVTKLLDTDTSKFLKCRNIGEYTLGEIDKLKHKLKMLIYGKTEERRER